MEEHGYIKKRKKELDLNHKDAVDLDNKDRWNEVV